MRVADFEFDLPEELIALRPARPRDAARLLEVRHGELIHRRVLDLPDVLQRGDCLVFNDTAVMRAQLDARRIARPAGEGTIAAEPRVGFTLHKRISADVWRAFAKPGRKLALGDRVRFGDTLEAEIIAKEAEGDFLLRFSQSAPALDGAIASLGAMPLPPYIASRRPADVEDETDYQTVYARVLGSVAAPTAGLHFTPALLATLETRGILSARVTLHVGAGTFLPMKGEDTSQHRLHAELGEVSEAAADAINRARAAGGRIVAVGTTSLRLLETSCGADGRIYPFRGETDLFILPGYRFKTADLLWTNFHLPRSTLLMLGCAFAGTETMLRAYAAAISQRYRFFSYGDATLLHRTMP
jgi:S-adenosylmethionine:tRNA ribosyltransferase-isomerase